MFVFERGRPQNNVSAADFSVEHFVELVTRFSLASEETADAPQTQYLAAYLDQLGAQSILVEEHYVDRHFVEEVGAYYSRCLTPPPNKCARLHFFSETLDEDRLVGLITRASEGAFEEVQQELTEQYLGFVVIRPIPSVPIGRTVLAPLSEDEDRKILCASRYRVHVVGFRLEVRGLAFQQQDRAVAACATTAVWSALQRVRRRDGARCPSPNEITEAAVKNLVFGRPFPSQGLTMEQIYEALRFYDFPPHPLYPDEDPLRFWQLINVYLRSGMPVILAIRFRNGSGHAVTAVGYRKIHEPSVTLLGGEAGIPLRAYNLEFSQLYVHDDRLGPYARMRIDHTNTNVEIDWPGGVEPATVSSAVVPMYPKLRTNARELLEALTDTAPTIEAWYRGQGQVGYEIFFARSGTYMNSLYRDNLGHEGLSEVQRSLSLSRYVGIVRWLLDGEPVLDVIWDSTDTLRETTYGDNLLALIARRPEDRDWVRAVGQFLEDHPHPSRA